MSTYGRLTRSNKEKFGPSVVYAVAVNCLYKDRVSRVRVRDIDRVSGRVTDRVRFRG